VTYDPKTSEAPLRPGEVKQLWALARGRSAFNPRRAVLLERYMRERELLEFERAEMAREIDELRARGERKDCAWCSCCNVHGGLVS
jgi:hypothetical protein